MNNILNIVLAGVGVIGAFGGLVWLEKELRLMKPSISIGLRNWSSYIR